MDGPASPGAGVLGIGAALRTLASLLATGTSLALLAAGMPAAAALAVHFLPLPYLLVAVVGVFRSSGRYAGPPLWARLAEIAVVLWAIFFAVL